MKTSKSSRILAGALLALSCLCLPLISSASDQSITSTWEALKEGKVEGCRPVLWHDGDKSIGPYLDAVFYNLIRKGAISISPRSSSSFKAFYLPEKDRVVIEPFDNITSLAKSLLHEVIHAFQYTYRFPLDLNEMKKLVTDGRFSKGQALRNLYYLYEAQAHWYVMRSCPQANWSPTKSSRLSTGIKATANVATFGALGALFNFRLNQLLPKIDEFSLRGGYCNTDPLVCFMHFREPMAFNQSSSKFVGVGTNVANLFERMSDFSAAVESSYFHQPFFREPGYQDQKSLVQLHDNFYSQFFIKDRESRKECQKLWISLRDQSPMMTWLKMDNESIQKCSIYSDVGRAAPLSDFFNEALESYWEDGNDSPFYRSSPGGEGVSPELNLIQPQIEIGSARDGSRSSQ